MTDTRTATDAPTTLTRTGPVVAVAAADPEAAGRHFAHRLAVETDPADVAEQLAIDPAAIVLVDTRSPDAYAEAHLPGAVNLHHPTITAESLAALPADALVVTYCWSISCNAATKGAARVAALGRPVKEMIGGIGAWRAEGLPVEAATGVGAVSPPT